MWAINSSNNLIKIINEVIVETWSEFTISAFTNNATTPINKQLITKVTGLNELQTLITSDNEMGAMIYADGEMFDQDEGIVIDSIDADDTVTIEGEQGAIVSGFEASSQGRLFYTREPVIDLLEISDHQAIIEFAKYRALEKTGDREGIPKASYFLAKFNDRLSKAKGFAARGSNNNPQGVTSQYY